MNNKEITCVKHVPFLGAELVAAQDSEGNIWAGVRWMCDGIGLTEGQRKRQIANIQSDTVLSQGGSNLVLPTGGGKQEVFCIRLDFLPLWLAKIGITPAMQEETPELAETLKVYQLQAKDKLAEAFLPQFEPGTAKFATPKSAMEMLRLQTQALFEVDERVSVLEDKLDNQMTIDHGQQRTLQQAVGSRVYERAAEIYPAKEFRSHTGSLFSALYHDLKTRFGVASYRDIRPADYKDAVAYVENWIEPAKLREVTQ